MATNNPTYDITNLKEFEEYVDLTYKKVKKRTLAAIKRRGGFEAYNQVSITINVRNIKKKERKEKEK